MPKLQEPPHGPPLCLLLQSRYVQLATGVTIAGSITKCKENTYFSDAAQLHHSSRNAGAIDRHWVNRRQVLHTNVLVLPCRWFEDFAGLTDEKVSVDR